jgi:hypothetical protein
VSPIKDHGATLLMMCRDIFVVGGYERRRVMAKSNQPAAKFRIGYVTATVWLNDKHYNTVLSRSYKDGEDYKETDQLGTPDLMNAARLLQRAEEWISQQS